MSTPWVLGALRGGFGMPVSAHGAVLSAPVGSWRHISSQVLHGCGLKMVWQINHKIPNFLV